MKVNNIFAKVSLKNEQGIYKLLSSHALFETLEVAESYQISYSPTHKLDEECWFVIDNFSSRKFSLDILEEEFVSIDYGQLQKSDFGKVSFIFSVQDDDFYFQKITSGKIIRKAKFIEFGETAKMQEVQNSFAISDFPDAVYLKKRDVLLFRSLERISSIFRGVDFLYREATNEETEKFLGSSFISLTEDYSSDQVKKANRKRIAMVMDKMSELEGEEKKTLIFYIAEYCPSLKFDKRNMHFEISNEENLKNLLYGIAENYFTTPVTNEKRVANSTQPIG